MKTRVYIEAERAAGHFDSLVRLFAGGKPSPLTRAEVMVEFAMALADVKTAVVAQLPDDPEAA